VETKMIHRWASVYVDKLLKDKAAAREWSHRFLPPETVDAVAAEARVILKRKGFKVLD